MGWAARAKQSQGQEYRDVQAWAKNAHQLRHVHASVERDASVKMKLTGFPGDLVVQPSGAIYHIQSDGRYRRLAGTQYDMAKAAFVKALTDRVAKAVAVEAEKKTQAEH